MIKRQPINSISLENMTFAYDGGATLFENISIEIPKAKAVWVRSPGGMGKSTIMRLLFGLLAPQKGKLLINGVDVADLPFEEFLAYRLNMGYGFDMGGLLNNKTLAENLMLPLEYHNVLPPDECQERVTQLVDSFGMTLSKDMRPYAVQGTLRKLTCILRAFVHWPQIVFLDDPLTGLKQDNINDLIYYIEESYSMRGLRQVFFTSESPTLANKFGAEELFISTDWFFTRTGNIANED